MLDKSIPILALTAEAVGENRERAFASGVDDSLAKPVAVDQLEEKVRALLDRNPSRT